MADIPEGSVEQRDYFSYLLRLWRTGEGDRSTWRASLKSAGSGEQVAFASLEDLFRFLRTQTGTQPGTDGNRQESS